MLYVYGIISTLSGSINLGYKYFWTWLHNWQIWDAKS